MSLTLFVTLLCISSKLFFDCPREKSDCTTLQNKRILDGHLVKYGWSYLMILLAIISTPVLMRKAKLD